MGWGVGGAVRCTGRRRRNGWEELYHGGDLVEEPTWGRKACFRPEDQVGTWWAGGNQQQQREGPVAKPLTEKRREDVGRQLESVGGCGCDPSFLLPPVTALWLPLASAVKLGSMCRRGLLAQSALDGRSGQGPLHPWGKR